MRKVLFVFLCLIICQAAIAQGKKGKKKKDWLDTSAIPTAVMDAYKAKYADVSTSKWKKTKKGNFKAFHKDGENKVEATFSPDGTWKHSRTKLATANIPESISAYVSDNYEDYELKKVVHHDNAGKGMKYLVHLKKGEEKMKLVFDKDGEFEKVRQAKKGKMAGDDEDEDDGK